MVIRDQLEEYMSYQKYVEGKNESWLREPKNLKFEFNKSLVSEIQTGKDLITRGGRVTQISESLVYDVKDKIIAPVWQDEFLYQALSKVPYDLRFVLEGSVDWKDEYSKSSILNCLCVVESGQKAYLSQYLYGEGLRSLDIVVKSGATLRHDVYMNHGEYDYINVYVESFGCYEQVYALNNVQRRAIRVLLMGDGATSIIRGCAGIGNDKVSREHVLTEHYAPNTQSEHMVRTILHGKMDINSKVYIHKTAWGAKSKQDVHHLLLCEKAKAFSKPALEIGVDDVMCEHGAVTSIVDNNLLFYMLTRGLSFEEAKALYVKGFVENAYLGNEDVKHKMLECIKAVL